MEQFLWAMVRMEQLADHLYGADNRGEVKCLPIELDDDDKCYKFSCFRYKEDEHPTNQFIFTPRESKSLKRPTFADWNVIRRKLG